MVSVRLSRAPRGDRYRYFWAKGVEGFDSTKCCLPSLVGPRVRSVSVDAQGDLELPATSPYLYICGSFAKYDTNTHIAMRPEAAASFVETTASGLVIEVRGAVRLEIPPVPAGLFSEKQRRCRNFRFGYSVFGAPAAAIAAL